MRKRQCWICFLEEEFRDSGNSTTVTNSDNSDNNDDGWVQPCKCKGSTRWVHQDCILAWLDRQNGYGPTTPPIHETPPLSPQSVLSDHNSLIDFVHTSTMRRNSNTEGPLVMPPSKCPQCHEPYVIKEGLLLPGALLKGLDFVQLNIERALVVGGVTFILGGIWCSSTIYGISLLSNVLNLDVPTMIDEMDGVRVVQFVIGTPLLPLYMLSFKHSLLHIMYPLVPLLTLSPTRFSDVNPDSLLASSLPLGVYAYNWFRKRVLHGIFLDFLTSTLLPGVEDIPRIGDDSSIFVSPSLSSLSSLTSASNTRNLDELTPTTPVTPTTTNTEEEEEEILSLRNSIVGSLSVLALPFVSAIVGKYLFYSTTRMTPLQKSIAGALLVCMGRDLFSAFSFCQRIYTRSSRRLLDNPIHINE